jgi:hypothetical protein
VGPELPLCRRPSGRRFEAKTIGPLVGDCLYREHLYQLAVVPARGPGVFAGNTTAISSFDRPGTSSLALSLHNNSPGVPGTPATPGCVHTATPRPNPSICSTANSFTKRPGSRPADWTSYTPPPRSYCQRCHRDAKHYPDAPSPDPQAMAWQTIGSPHRIPGAMT